MKMRLDLLAWTAAAAMAAIPATALAAVDSFIWFEGEHGTSTDSGHQGWFDIKNFSHAVEGTSAMGSATSGAGAGKAKFQEFSITRVTDRASPTFQKALATGRHYSTVKITMRKAGGDPHQYMTYEFHDVLISKMNMGGASSEGPEESITFVYGSMQVHYSNQATGGSPTAPAPTKIFQQQQGRNPQPNR